MRQGRNRNQGKGAIVAIDYKAMIGDGLCADCRGRLGLVFKRIRVDTGIINAGAVQRHMGLEMMLGGNAALADVFSPEREPMVKFSSEEALGETVCVCSKCYARGVDPAVLIESQRELRAAAAAKERCRRVRMFQRWL